MKKNRSRVTVIAEIGTGHGGDLHRARRLVDAAVDAGADCAKFQIVYADEILHPDTGFVALPGGSIRLYDRFRELEMPVSFFADMAEYCGKKGLEFMCTPFGLKSARELAAMKPRHIKIASPELNHFPLLREAASYGIPLILSTGVSRLADIEKALDETAGASERVLLHCITSYPAPEDEYNLNVLENLARIFGVRVGVSDHSLDPVLVPVLSVARGACMIEKHITLSRDDPGLDDPVALSPDLFSRMVERVRKAEALDAGTIIENMKGEYGEKRIDAVLGSGVKALSKSEAGNYTRTNRTIHFLRAMKKGERITERDIALLRTEKILSPGISGEYLGLVTGKVLSRDVQNGAGLVFEDLVG
jgi:sialic acid synthase SpsE